MELENDWPFNWRSLEPSTSIQFYHIVEKLSCEAFSYIRIVIVARTADKLANTKTECEQYTTDVHTVIADVSKENDCREIVNKAVEEFGGIDILILNAVYSPKPQFFTDSKESV